MLKIKKIFPRVLLVVGAIGCLFTPIAGEESPTDSTELKQMLDSVGVTVEGIESKVRSTLMFGGSSPVSFSGEARVKLQFHQMKDPPPYLKWDESYLSSNWEGNESFVRLGMVARAGRNAVLWSKIGFQHTLPGNFLRSKDNPSKQDSLVNGFYRADSRHDKSDISAIIHEDMSAGIAIRTVPASFWLKMGSVQWIEASPLTIWKSQPRTFAWEYLPFEVEQPISRYYEYNIAKGEKSGRAAWNKKAFQGISFESINLPADLYFNFFYGTYERYDNFEREFMDFSNDLAYAGDYPATASKGRGIGDSYRHVFHSRFSANELLGRLTPSLNLMFYKYDDEIFKLSAFKTVFGYNVKSDTGRMFYKEPTVASVDIRGPINDKLNIFADFAFSVVDTNWFIGKGKEIVDEDAGTAVSKTELKNTKTSMRPAFYGRVESKYGIPINLDFALISEGFYSPLSFAVPSDIFYPFGSNLVGPGKFIARGEASPYSQNMTGINLQVAPKLSGYGHLKFSYGQHLQLNPGQDVIYFPYRLNGQDLFSMFNSSYTRWGNFVIDNTMPAASKYRKRLGDESFITTADKTPVGSGGGGLRSDYLGMMESFVPYESAEQADSNSAEVKQKNKDGVYRQSKWVPRHQKFSFSADFDFAYDISSMIGYSNDLFFSIYGALNSVSTSFLPCAFNAKNEDMLLFGSYLRMEPAVALSKKFYLLGLVGFESWKSEKAYVKEAREREVDGETVRDSASVACPINYRDFAIGIGFDWDMLSRVGLHGRIKWMKHDDAELPKNNYATPVISTEIKMWF